MRAEAERLARSFENDAKIASARVETLTASLDQLKRQAASTRTSRTCNCARWSARPSRSATCWNPILRKYREATARDSIGAASPDARIISRPIVSNTPSWPKKLPTVLIAALGMFTLSMGFILTGQLMGGRRPRAAPARPSPSRPASVSADSRSRRSTSPPETPSAMLPVARPRPIAAGRLRCGPVARSPP